MFLGFSKDSEEHKIWIQHLKENHVGMKGKHHTEETKRKLSEKSVEVHNRPGMRQKMSIATSKGMLKGRTPTKWTGYNHAEKMYPDLGNCEVCFERDAVIRHHKDQDELHNTRRNVQFVCKGCHERLHSLVTMFLNKFNIGEII